MTQKEISDLIKLVNRLDLTEFKMRDGEFELSIRTKHYEKSKRDGAPIAATAPVLQVPPVQQPAAPAPPAAQPAAPAAPRPAADEGEKAGNEDSANYLEVKSPIVGTFYRSSSPEKPPYVKVGDVIEKGSVVCIVEAMKLFNEIESEISGTIVKVMVEDAQPVEYDQVLFLVDPK